MNANHDFLRAKLSIDYPNIISVMNDKPYSEEGYELMGAAFEVHNEMGGGLREEIYQQSLEKELVLQNIPFATKSEIDVFYKG